MPDDPNVLENDSEELTSDVDSDRELDPISDVDSNSDSEYDSDSDSEEPEPPVEPEVWIVTLPSGNQYYVKDLYARQCIEELYNIVSEVMHYRGRSLTPLEDGSTVNPIVLDGEILPYTAKNGDVVTYRPDHDSDSDSDSEEPVIELEFAWTGNHWQEYGSSGALKALAFKDTASTQYTPKGININGNVTLTHDTVNSITDVGRLPTLPTASVSNGQLIFTAGDPGILPTKGVDQRVAVDVDQITQPTFVGTDETITVS